MARKSKYDPETMPLLAEGYARQGLNDVEISTMLGISPAIYYQYQNKYSEFFEAIKRGKAPVDVIAENSLFKRVKGYDYEETTTEVRIAEDGSAKPAVIRKVTKHVPPDVGAIAFWLKNRKPKQWKETRYVDMDIDDKRKDIDDLFPPECEMIDK